MIRILTEEAPRPLGPYSQGIKVGNLIFASGQLGIDPLTGELKESFEEEVRQAFRNLEAILKGGDSGLKKVVKLTVFLSDLSLFPTFNQICEEVFEKVYPARECVEVSALPLKARVEISAIAWSQA
jgi:2-iminobutanoate/2-iminopropanoate deaminase